MESYSLLALFRPRYDAVLLQKGSKLWTERLNDRTTLIRYVSSHLAGHRRVGLYPVHPDGDTCFLAYDLDVKDKTKARQIIEHLKGAGVPESHIYWVESRSKRGWHFYVFFDRPVPARVVRQRFLLNLEKLDFFPRQDSVPEGSPGNGIFIPYYRGESSREWWLRDLQGKVVEPSSVNLYHLEMGETETEPQETRNVTEQAVTETQNAPEPSEKNPGVDPVAEGVSTSASLEHVERTAPHCIRQLLNGVGEGFRNNAAFIIANYLRDNPNRSELLRRWNERNDPPLNERELADVEARTAKHDYPRIPCNMLQDYCDPNCPRKVQLAILNKIQEKYSVDRFKKRAEEYLRNHEVTLPWKSAKLTALTGGAVKREITVVAAPTGHGKTTWSIDQALTWARQGRRVMFFSLEMSTEQLSAKILAHFGVYAYDYIIKYGKKLDFDALWNEYERLIGNRLLIIDDVYKTRDMYDLARAWMPDVIVIDWIQYLDGIAQNPIYEIGDRLKELKAIAKDLDLAVLIMAQTSRSADFEGDDPRNSWIADSSLIEKLAATIMFLYDRNAGGAAVRRWVDFWVTKARYGRLGRAKLLFDPMRMKYLPEVGDDQEEQEKRAPVPEKGQANGAGSSEETSAHPEDYREGDWEPRPGDGSPWWAGIDARSEGEGVPSRFVYDSPEVFDSS